MKKLHINNPLTVFAGTVLFPAADRRSQEGILELCHIFRTSISNSYTAKPQNQLRKESQGDIKCVLFSYSLTHLQTSVTFCLFFQLFIFIMSSCTPISYFLSTSSLFSITPVHSLARSELNFILSATGCSFSENFQ